MRSEKINSIWKYINNNSMRVVPTGYGLVETGCFDDFIDYENAEGKQITFAKQDIERYYEEWRNESFNDDDYGDEDEDLICDTYIDPEDYILDKMITNELIKQ